MDACATACISLMVLRSASFLADGIIVRVVSKNRPGYYWSIDEGIEGYLMQEAELFKVINPGLYGEGSVSFESVTRPGMKF